MIARHVMISGRVQGVGYRAWVAREAEQRALSGWVRNLASGEVEAVFAGERRAVDAMVDACRLGPRLARVVHVEVVDTECTATEFEIR